jgi:hypothetical protein
MASYPVYYDDSPIPGADLSIGGNLEMEGSGGQIIFTAAVVAANATGTQASGTPIIAGINHVTSGGAGYSVTLPVSVPGMSITIACATAVNTVKVFPNAGGTGTEIINALAPNAAITMGAQTSCEFVCALSGQWFSLPKVPS